MNRLRNGKTILSLLVALSLVFGGVMLTACSGSGGLGITIGGDNPDSGESPTALNPNLILMILLILVVIVAVVALGALGKK